MRANDRTSDIRDYRLFLVRTNTRLLLWPFLCRGMARTTIRAGSEAIATMHSPWASMRWSGGKAGTYLTRLFATYEKPLIWPDDVSFARMVLRAFADHTIDRTDDTRLADLPNVTA